MTRHILITGAAGFVAQQLTSALLAAAPDYHLTLTDIVSPSSPDPSRTTSIQADLTDPAEVASLLSSQAPWHAIYALHGVMSSTSESHLELGYKVNLDAHRHIYDYLLAHPSPSPKVKVIFTSSCAIYGPPSTAGPTRTFTEHTLPLPQTSYGTQKLMIEALLTDYTRRGILDARIARLPSVVVRAGAPTGAASSWMSGILREPLNGQPSILPVDKNLDVWLCSPGTVVHNLILLKDIPEEKFQKYLSRAVNLPGITVGVKEMLDVLEEVGGKEARGLVREEVDEKTEKICLGWPERFDTSRARELGLREDVGLLEGVRAYKASLGK
ncbi:putative nucleoside-diphosphate-sugar epimerase protein [Favolaschia claudopus]|uniref:Nucleoside-diphosphate-sugar epimerase protein n=1 Tax=Favolaschia claudopus TaxID=2862362 RepID=A0AAW0EFI5_9AGAR